MSGTTLFCARLPVRAVQAPPPCWASASRVRGRQVREPGSVSGWSSVTTGVARAYVLPGMADHAAAMEDALS